jgi:hypothetical protein
MVAQYCEYNSCHRIVHIKLQINFFGRLKFVLAKQTFYHLSHISNLFYSGYFRDGVSKTICLGWLSASQVARITGMSNGHPEKYF